MKRLYDAVVQEHLAKNTQMIFLSGPRQVGKTTIAQHASNYTDAFYYYNWDDLNGRDIILGGSTTLLKAIDLKAPITKKPILCIDELHKCKQWKNLIKGIYDAHKNALSIIVTGSSRLNAFRRTGDSLMGRYFLYRIHPLSVGELLDTSLRLKNFSPPRKIANDLYDALFKFGGFPDPFLRQEERFAFKWNDLRHQQLLREDLDDLSHIQELSSLEILITLIEKQVGQLCNYSNLAKKIRVSDQSIRRWITILEELHYCFRIRPWSKNVTRSLIKEPKLYLWDWSRVEDIGFRVENFVASHLYKAVHYWRDTGLGKYELFFVRDKDKREVDFLITENDKPWMLIEAKTSSEEKYSENLDVFRKQLQPKYTFQVVHNMEYIDIDISTLKTPKIVPLKTFLSQLV